MPVTLPKPKPKTPKPAEADPPPIKVPKWDPRKQLWPDPADNPNYNAFDLLWAYAQMEYAIGVGDPLYNGQPIPQTDYLRKAGPQKNRPYRCVTTTPNTKANQKSDQRVIKMRDCIRLALEQYEIGYAIGFRIGNAKIRSRDLECKAIERNCRRLNDQLKRLQLSQDPSFPRKKSKTGVTRIGRRRKGPG